MVRAKLWPKPSSIHCKNGKKKILVWAIGFDTTYYNTELSAGACIIFEQLLIKHFLHSVYGHCILKIIIGSVFPKSLGSAGALEIGLFKRFQAQ